MFGLILSGGHSTRMGSDKGSLVYQSGRSQRLRCAELLSGFCEKVFVSCREEQLALVEPGFSVIVDSFEGGGPGVGILSAHLMYPERSWLVLACDFPFASVDDIARLVQARSSEFMATCYVQPGSDFIEPLFAIWEPEALRVLKESFLYFDRSPSRVLASLSCKRVEPLRGASLRNVNQPLLQIGLPGHRVRQ